MKMHIMSGIGHTGGRVLANSLAFSVPSRSSCCDVAEKTIAVRLSDMHYIRRSRR